MTLSGAQTTPQLFQQIHESIITCERCPRLRDYCRGRIAHFKIPQYIRFVEAFPMTISGKVQKFRMREQEIRERHLDAAAEIETA